MKILRDLTSNLAKKLLFNDKDRVFLLDKIEIDFKEVGITQIIIPPISEPQGIKIQFFQKSAIKDFDIKLSDSGQTCIYNISNENLDKIAVFQISAKLSYPIIKNFSVNIEKPATIGISYKKYERKNNVSTLFPISDDNLCIHGLKRKFCSICGKSSNSEKTKSKSNFFQLILPILQTPLGDNFDSPIAFQDKKLYPFQRDGVKFLVNHKQAILGDEMGLGKSIQAIVAIRLLFRIGEIVNVIIICPKSVLTDWEKKLNDWAPELRVVKICGTPEQRKIIWHFPAHVYLITYDTLRQDENESRKDFDLVILDEIQKIKNPSAGITKAVRRINGKIRWGLSGTPLENYLEELVSIFAYIKPGLLHYSDVQNSQKIKELIKPFFLRRRKQDVMKKLPKKFNEEVWLELTPAQRKEYDKAEKEGIIDLKRQGLSVTVQHVLALISKLKQICNLAPRSKESCKLEYLIEKLEEITEQGEKAIVFSQYPNKTLRLLEPSLKKFNPLVYDGSLSETQRDAIIKKFQEDEQNKIILMSVKAGGLGLTLTRANYVFHFDLWWNPSVALQAEDRTHRIGQKKTVFVSSLFTVNTIEERIQNLLNKKRQLFKDVIDDLSDTRLSKILSEEELFSLFNLKKSKK
ncbi:DEAD/DEAH box helicase [Thermodesulfovibrio yellowstonii]|uniref:Helicase n=1 Tax=Thermodesulfovibrio yellowstonii TaxID=28262 RepID=A0A9W6LKU3_9BACT|nr:DEAD/DEAH box helicase [Thermodesulfovibrio islandicus]GLI53989.1 helicase [Thermodesulfovibrio islandicus]